MDPRLWHKITDISGMAALGLVTYGFHVFKPDIASLYHLVHTAVLLAAHTTSRHNIFGGRLTTGILAFYGTCYIVAYLEDRKFAILAPFGGFAFIGAWTSLLF